MSDFDQVANGPTPPSDFEGVSDGGQSPTSAPAGNIVTARIAALASIPGAQALTPEATAAMQAQLASGREAALRAQVALDSQQRQMANFNTYINGNQDNAKYALSNDTTKTVNDTYNALASQNIEERSKASLEREAITRIQDDLSTDPVEAKVTYQLMFGDGDATKVWHDEAAKNLIIAQKLQEYQQESDQETWGGRFYNFLTGLIPFNDNFAHMGDVPGSGGFSIKNFLLSGTSMQSQREDFWNKYRTPEAMADALKDGGGEMDQALRSNATTLFGYAPSNAAELLHELNYQTDADRMTANAWSLLNVGAVVPWTKVGQLPAMLVRMGSRSTAKSALAGAITDVIEKGPLATAAEGGISQKTITENLELSAMHPTGATPNSVPLSTEVTTHLAAAKQYLAERLPTDIKATRATTPDEIKHMIDSGIKDIEATTGRSARDIQIIHTDLQTGVETPYKIGDAIPEQGNSVMHVEVSFGRKGGGLFASPKTAYSNLKSAIGVDIAPVFVDNGVEKTVTNAEAGFTLRGFHGTDAAFDTFDHAKAGANTGAENTAGTIFLSSDPEVAMSYAKLAAAKTNNEGFAAAKALFDHPDPAVREAAMNEAGHHLDRMIEGGGGNIRPIDINPNKLYEADMKGASYNGPTTQAILDHARKEGYDGVIMRNYDDDVLGGKTSDVYAIFNKDAMRSSLEGPQIVRDVSGGWVGKARFAVKEEGFITSTLDTPIDHFFSGLRSDARRVDPQAHAKAVAGGANSDTAHRVIVNDLKQALKGVTSGERKVLDEVIKKGMSDGKYYSGDEFKQLYERATGNLPRQSVHDAYDAYRLANDAAYHLRNDIEYTKWHTAGYENVKLDLGKTGITYDDRGLVTAGGNKPTERVFNVSDNVQYNSRHPLTQQEFERLTGEGYVVVTTKGVELPDGTRLRKVLVKRGELERSPLKREQLNYSEGGSRDYGKQSYFVKQTSRGIQPDTMSEYIANPNVFVAGRNPNVLRDWAEIFNKAIDDAKSGIRDPQHFDDNIFANNRGLKFPTGQEFVDAVESKTVSLHDHVEVLGDREMPKAYQENGINREDFMDPDETSIGGYYRSTGRLYTSRKGDHLPDAFGNPAETVDPWETMNTSLANISRMSSLAGYKTNIISRFKATYGKYLNINNLESLSDSDLMNAAVSRNVTDRTLIGKIKSEQAAVKRVLNFETDFEKKTRAVARNVAEWVLKDSRGGDLRAVAHDATYWLAKNNPINFIHGLAFDSKLGFFNPGQFILQSSTMLASAALSPKHGMKGMFGTVPMFAYITSKGSESVLDTLAKNGAWKIASFESEQEFKDFARYMHKTGFLNVNSTHLSVNDFRANRAFGAAGKWDAVKQMSRVFFYSAEVFNRSVAGRIAWEELKEQALKPGTAAFRDRFVQLADDYSFNMTSQSSAAFQKGLWSIPTQFWGYNVRMMDAMFGNRFTQAQKARLIASQFLFYGAGGVPLVDSLSDWAKGHDPNAPDNNAISTALGKLDRGAFDTALSALGANVQFGEKLGTGQFVTQTFKDIFGMSEYGDKTPAEMIGGATGSIGWSMGKTMFDAIKYAAAETGSDQGYAVTKDDLVKLANNFSTFSNTSKAFLVDRYGIYRSNSGSISVDNLPSTDAFAIAMGYQPQELADAKLKSGFIKDRDQIVKDTSTQIRNWRMESFNVPEKRSENERKVNFLMQQLPDSLKRDVLKRTNHATDASFYEHLDRKYQQEKLEAANDDG